jgi:hypothetical protein
MIQSDYVMAAISIGSILVTWGITVGLFYAHVLECARFRRDIVDRLNRIESSLRKEF